MSGRPNGRRRWLWIKALVSVGLLAWLGYRMVRRDGVELLVERLASLDVGWLAVAIALHFVAVVAGVSRWKTLLEATGLQHGFGRLLRSFLVGRFVGAFTPSTTGLDGWRLYDVGRAPGAMARSAAVIVVEKLVGLVGMAIVCAGLIPFGGIELMGPTAPLAALGMASAAIVGLGLLRRPAWIAAVVERVPHAKARAIGAKVVDALGQSRLDARGAGTAVTLGVISHLALSSVFFATARSIGVDASPLTLLVAGNAITLAVLLPVSVGGVGVREGVAVVLLATVGVVSTDAVLVALLGYLTGQVPALLGGVLTLVDRRPEVPSPA
ncbi:MAG: flippase-like domain-containing protein [Sandaracinaceae bacterium]|nr:flippase-like domain-containing protein [Sandaracinaceae bacterium]